MAGLVPIAVWMNFGLGLAFFALTSSFAEPHLPPVQRGRGAGRPCCTFGCAARPGGAGHIRVERVSEGPEHALEHVDQPRAGGGEPGAEPGADHSACSVSALGIAGSALGEPGGPTGHVHAQHRDPGKANTVQHPTARLAAPELPSLLA